MSPALKFTAIALSGALLGAIMWLWMRFGTEVFQTYLVAFASWCF